MTILLVVVCVILVLIALICNLHDRAVPPYLYFKESQFNRAILQHCPLLLSSYIPTHLWGKSGHIQTMIYGKMGRINSPMPRGQRHFEVLPDGATMSYDIFEPAAKHPYEAECTLLVCPGIANSSESVYIRTYVQFAQDAGFRVAVLNHLGALRDIPLTAPRIFTYGGTEEYGVMVGKMMEDYPSSLFIAVGFSMGGNIITKFVGEHPEIQKRFIGGVACCQGYDVMEVAPYLMSWRRLRRLYVMAMTRHHIGLLRHHSRMLFGPEAIERYGHFDQDKIFAAKILLDVDQNYSHKRAGFKTCEEYYHWCSSHHFMDGIKIPFLFLNAVDDPLVPPELLHIPKDLAMKRDNVILAVTRHGGHLGYFEGGFIMPNGITWLDRVVVEFCRSLVHINAQICDNRQISAVCDACSDIKHTNAKRDDMTSSMVVVNGTTDHINGQTTSALLTKPVLFNGLSQSSLQNSVCETTDSGAVAASACLPVVPL